MEYVEGKTIEERIREGILPEEAFRYAAQVYNGILSLRAHDITHRDLNKRNIKVQPDGIVKIIDFGIATQERVPAVIAPGRLSPPMGDPADDLYSLGMLTYEMITGKNLILEKEEGMASETHRQNIETIKRDLYDDGQIRPAYAERIRMNVAGPLQKVIFACLEKKDPYARLLDVRDAFVAGDPSLQKLFSGKTILGP